MVNTQPLYVNGYVNFSESVAFEKKQYEDYKERRLTDISDKELTRIQILELLECLGFPMDEVGTFYYKDLICRIIELLNEGLSREDISVSLETPFSQIYFDVARNELDIGIKYFKEIIDSAFCKIDIDTADAELLAIIVEKMNEAKSNNQLPLVLAVYFQSLKDVSQRLLTDKK